MKSICSQYFRLMCLGIILNPNNKSRVCETHQIKSVNRNKNLQEQTDGGNQHRLTATL